MKYIYCLLLAVVLVIGLTAPVLAIEPESQIHLLGLKPLTPDTTWALRVHYEFASLQFNTNSFLYFGPEVKVNKGLTFEFMTGAKILPEGSVPLASIRALGSGPIDRQLFSLVEYDYYFKEKSSYGFFYSTRSFGPVGLGVEGEATASQNHLNYWGIGFPRFSVNMANDQVINVFILYHNDDGQWFRYNLYVYF